MIGDAIEQDPKHRSLKLGRRLEALVKAALLHMVARIPTWIPKKDVSDLLLPPLSHYDRWEKGHATLRFVGAGMSWMASPGCCVKLHVQTGLVL